MATKKVIIENLQHEAERISLPKPSWSSKKGYEFEPGYYLIGLYVCPRSKRTVSEWVRKYIDGKISKPYFLETDEEEYFELRYEVGA